MNWITGGCWVRSLSQRERRPSSFILIIILVFISVRITSSVTQRKCSSTERSYGTGNNNGRTACFSVLCIRTNFLSNPHDRRNGKVKDSSREAMSGQRCCEDRSGLHAGVLLPDGRFAFIMFTYWGDLRKLIDIWMQYKRRNEGPPYTRCEVADIMMQNAVGTDTIQYPAKRPTFHKIVNTRKKIYPIKQARVSNPSCHYTYCPDRNRKL